MITNISYYIMSSDYLIGTYNTIIALAMMPTGT